MNYDYVDLNVSQSAEEGSVRYCELSDLYERYLEMCRRYQSCR